jgi:hypothetical protein
VEDSPKTQTEWLKLAAISAIDLVPGGKALKLLKGAAGKVAMKKIEKQLLKEAKKAAKQIKKVATNRVKSMVKKDNKLLKLAQETFEGNSLLRKEANILIEQLNRGNMNPGIGTKSIGKNIFEARSRGGARVYFQNGPAGIEIVGYSNKANQQQVINRILELY